jgi:AcrR family transcriptional regulator
VARGLKSQAPVGEPAPVVDGRRQRGQDNRARIVAAMLEIIQGGDLSPSAEQVAARADVGLRTVFRHFQDMDSLYREMSVAIEAEMRAVVDSPFRSEDWRERVVELIYRRSGVFERIGPFKRASDAFRHRSKFLEGDGARLTAALREILKRELPPAVIADPPKLEILDLLLSYESWSRLRREQGLSVKRAQEALETAVRRLIA